MKRFSYFFRLLLSLFLCYLLAGCPGPLNVPVAWVNSFAGNGASENEIRAALLECGSKIPGYDTEYRTPEGKRFPDASANETVLVTKCMINSGFSNRSNFEKFCSGGTDINGKFNEPVSPACKPDAVIPKRSIDNRLNSMYCKAYPKAKICQPNYDPSKVTNQ